MVMYGYVELCWRKSVILSHHQSARLYCYVYQVVGIYALHTIYHDDALG